MGFATHDGNTKKKSVGTPTAIPSTMNPRIRLYRSLISGSPPFGFSMVRKKSEEQESTDKEPPERVRRHLAH